MSAKPLSDAALPGLRTALDRDALLELLHEHLPETRAAVRLLDARVVDVQYEPGSAAQALWKLSLREADTGRSARQLITVRALPRHAALPEAPASLVRRYLEIRARGSMARERPLRTPWLAVPGSNVVVQAFPLDPALPSLLDVTDPEAMKQALHRAWQPRHARVRRVRPDLLSYTPAARAALRYDVLAEDKRTALPEQRRLVGKIDARRAPARLFTGHWAVWRSGFGRASIAPPAGYLAVARLSLQEFVNGTRLSDLAGHGSFIGLLRQSARAIASVHRLTLPLLRERGIEKEMSSVDRWCDVLTGLRPDQAQRLAAVRGRLRRELAARIRITGAVHADFHLANVLADEHGVTIIDWDQVAHGDPMVDIGRVLASLRVASLRVHGTIDGFAGAADAFLHAYLTATGEDVRRVRLFEAASLLVAAAAPFRLQRDGWEEGADRMLAEVEHALARSLSGATVGGACVTSAPPAEPASSRTAPARIERCRGIPFDERSSWALDPTYAQALLVPIVHETYGTDIEVTECHPVLRDRSATRFRVHWTLKGYRGGERWRAALEGIGSADQSGHGLQHRLELARTVLHGRTDALQLPRPLGHLGPLSMLVFERAAGEPLVRLLGGPDEDAVLARLAGALAGLQSLPMDIRRERPLASELDSLQERIARSGVSAAGEILRRLRTCGLEQRTQRAPAVRGLHLDTIHVEPASIAIGRVDDLVLADPLLNAGELAARLRERQLRQRAATAAADRFAAAFRRATGISEAELRAFETLFLLRRAASRCARRPDDPCVARLLHAARTQLEMVA